MSQSPPNLLVPVCPRKVYPGDSCTVSCTGLDSDICIGQSNVVFVADDLKKDLCKKGFESDKNGFIVRLPNKKLSHSDYCIELIAMCFGCINIVLDSIMCVMQVVIKSVINTILFVQTLIGYIITGLYNTLSFVVNCWALVPCLIYLFLANNCRFIICNNGIGPCCIYYKIQVIIISLPAMAITWYILGALGIIDAVMTSAGYQKITTKPPSAFFYLRTSSQNVIDYDMGTVTTLKYFEEDINMDDFTEQETNFMQFVTVDKITPYTEEQANFTETETPDNLKDISIYDTIIEYDYMTEKIQTTEKEESVTKPKPPDKYHANELYSIFQDENPELNKTVASMIDTTHNFEEIAKGFIETTYKFEFETSDKVEETTTKVQKSTAKEEKTTQHIFFKASETSKEQTSETEQTFGIITETDFKVTESEIKVSSYLVEENFITEGMTTSTEFPEAFVVLEESTTKPDVENDKTRSTYTTKLKGISIYDDTESTINYKDISTSKESTRKFEEITSMLTTTVPTVQSFEEVTESFDNTISEQSTITEVPEEFVMLEESTTKSNFEEESTIVSPKTWIVVDEETNTVKFEEVTFDLGTT